MARLHALVWGLLVCAFSPSESLSVPNQPRHKLHAPGARAPFPRAGATSKMFRMMAGARAKMMRAIKKQVNNSMKQSFRMVEELIVNGAEQALLPGARGDHAPKTGKPAAAAEGMSNLVEVFLRMNNGGELGEAEQKQVHRMSDFTTGFLDGMVSHRSAKCMYTRFDPATLAKSVDGLTNDPLTAIAGLWEVLTPLTQDTRECQNAAHDVIDTVDAAAKSGTQVMSNLLFHLGSTMFDLRTLEGDVVSSAFKKDIDMKKIGHDVGDLVHLGMTGQSTPLAKYVPQRVKTSQPPKKEQKGIFGFGSFVSSIKKAFKSKLR